MRAIANSKAVADAVGLLIAVALFTIAANLRPPSQNVLLGVATSFVFFAILDLLLASQRAALNIARSRFFGPELTHGHPTFAYPDFEPHRDVIRALKTAGTYMRYQRPTSRVRALADYWIDVPRAAASNDIEAILTVAAVFGGLAPAPDIVLTDRQLISSCDRSFLSFGLASSACTYLYLDHAGPGKLFDLIPEPTTARPRMYAQTGDGRQFHSDDRSQYGLILRYAPDRQNYPGRRWFIIGGLGPQATIGAAWYLAHHWRHLARLTSNDQDFAAFISVPVMAPHSARHPTIISQSPVQPVPGQHA